MWKQKIKKWWGIAEEDNSSAASTSTTKKLPPPYSFPSTPSLLSHPENMTSEERQKAFTWQHYVGGNSLFESEFGSSKQSIQVLKSAYGKDDLIQTSVETIAKQFLGCSFQVVKKDTKEEIKNHPLLPILHSPIKNDCGTFHFENIVEMYITGTNYCIWIPTEKKFLRLPTEAVTPEIDAETGDVSKYKITTYKEEYGFKEQYVSPEDIWVSKLPNIFNRHVGMSAILSASLPALSNKYSLEFIIGFFLRGGNMSGIVELDKTDTSQISRLMLTIQQIMGTRRNMHSDKYLPKGAKWVAGGQQFSDTQIIEVIKQSRRLFNARLGIPPALVGDTDGVNYANAESQIKLFWENTIIPLQKLYCRSITNSVLGVKYLRDGEELEFNNSGVKYIDPFVDKLNEDHKLKELLTLNERRTRLGFDPVPDERADEINFQAAQVNPTRIPMTEAERLRQEAPQNKSLKMMKEKNLTKMNNLLVPTKELKDIFSSEFKRWFNIYTKSVESKSEAMRLIYEGEDRFLKKVTPHLQQVMKDTFFIHMESTTIQKKSLQRVKMSNDEIEQMLRNLWLRSEAFLNQYCERQARNAFKGYTRTATEEVYTHISKMLEKEPEMSYTKLADSISEKFGEAYANQASTIINTELGSASSIGSGGYAKALSSVTTSSRKQWYARNMDSPRHGIETGLHESWVEWDTTKTGTLEDVTFFNGLRHPRDILGSAEEAINCQCTVFFEMGAIR